MADTQVPFGDSTLGRGRGGATEELNARWFAGLTMDDHVGEGNAGSKTGAKGFQDGFLCRKAGGKAFDAVGSRCEVIQLGGSETAR